MYGKSIWFIVLSKVIVLTTQRIFICEFIPKEEIAKNEKDGYFITSMTYGDSKWVLFYSSGKNITEQKLIVSTEFPFCEIQKCKYL
jgi:hypothetical protein